MELIKRLENKNKPNQPSFDVTKIKTEYFIKTCAKFVNIKRVKVFIFPWDMIVSSFITITIDK